MKNLTLAFLNPPHADWSLANNLTYLQCQSHYKRYGRYHPFVHWIPAPYRWNQYENFEEVYQEIQSAQIILFSSYVWNSQLLDELAKYIKMKNPSTLLVIGGPHIGTYDPLLLKKRKDLYDIICRPTKPGEVFVEDLIDQWFEDSQAPVSHNISWALDSHKSRSFLIDQEYSVYEDHLPYLTACLNHAKKFKMEPFMALETTRGCPYRCVYCEWGGGINTKIQKKSISLVKRDIQALKKAGFHSAYLTDANFGVFKQRDFEIFKYAWEHNFNLTDISSVKTPNLTLRKELVDYWFEIVGPGPEKHTTQEKGTDMWGEMDYVSLVPTVSLQSISDQAMKIARRVDLKAQDKIKLSEHIHQKCKNFGYPAPSLELILGMPGSTLDDFYEEMNIIWNFQAWSSFRHDYMFLPDSDLSSPEYRQKYQIKTVKVYSDIVDEDGVDNHKSLYTAKETHFETIRSCYSFTTEEMIEMWFMNNASNFLLRYIYPEFINFLSAANFAKESYLFLKEMEDFAPLHREMSDLFNPHTKAKSIRRLGGNFRVITIEFFLKKHVLFLKNHLMQNHFPQWNQKHFEEHFYV